jgi:hypothetical protein
VRFHESSLFYGTPGISYIFVLAARCNGISYILIENTTYVTFAANRCVGQVSVPLKQKHDNWRFILIFLLLLFDWLINQ